MSISQYKSLNRQTVNVGQMNVRRERWRRVVTFWGGGGWSLDPTLSLFEYLGPDFLWSK